MQRTILHSDMNNFYASVECLFHPEWRNRPLAVGGDVKERHGIVLAKNEAAKKFGVQTGEALWQARKKCPTLFTVPPHHDLYLRFSKMAKEIYSEYTSRVEPFGLDECWLDVSEAASLFGSGEALAHLLRKRIRQELGLTVSIGVSFNKIFAKLGSDMKKPDAVTVIPAGSFQEKIWPLPVESLLYVGKSTQKRLENLGIHTIGELACTDVLLLQRLLGKIGSRLWSFANGLDHSPVSSPKETRGIKSIGNSATPYRDLTTVQDMKILLCFLSESVARRLREQGLRCRSVQVILRDNRLFSFERQKTLPIPVETSKVIYDAVFQLYLENDIHRPYRSVGVRACDLSRREGEQLSLFSEIERKKEERLETAVDNIRRRFGEASILRGLMLSYGALSPLRPKEASPDAYPVHFPFSEACPAVFSSFHVGKELCYAENLC